MESRAVTTEVLMPAIKELIDSGKTVKLTITGNSMLPLLRHEIDVVELSAFTGEVHYGDMLLIKRDDSVYVLHRVISLDNVLKTFFLVGDAQVTVEGPLRFDQIIAKVVAFHKNEKRVEVTNLVYKSYVKFWMKIRRYRPRILSILRKLRIIP